MPEQFGGARPVPPYPARSSISQAWSKACQAERRIAYRGVHSATVRRPTSGSSPSTLDSSIARIALRIEESFHLLPETHDVYREWRKLVVLHSVSGLKVYDARLVAISIVHQVKAILTFNVDDFRRYPGIESLHPRQVVGKS